MVAIGHLKVSTLTLGWLLGHCYVAKVLGVVSMHCYGVYHLFGWLLGRCYVAKVLEMVLIHCYAVDHLFGWLLGRYYVAKVF